MKQFILLFWHVLKNMKLELLFILAIIVFPFGLSKFIDFLNPTLLDRILMSLNHYWFYLFPVLFVYSLYRGEKKQLIYQAESHPIKKHYHLLIKYLIFVHAMILMELIYTVRYLLIFHNILPKPKIKGAAFAGPRVFVGGLMDSISTIFITLSLVCAAWGIMKVAKRFRPFFGLAVVIIGWELYFRLGGEVGSFGKTFNETRLYELLFALCLGSIFCAIGVYFHKKFGAV